MIVVTIKDSKDVDAYEFLLNQNDYTFKKMFKRVFTVDCKLSDYVLKNHPLTATANEEAKIELKPNFVNITDNNVRAWWDDPVVTNKQSWGPHRIIRRFNPFTKQRPARLDELVLPYRCQRTGVGVDIYVGDYGFDCNHDEFGGRAVEIDSGSDTYVSVGVIADNASTCHGTICASNAAGNTVGIARDANLFFQEITLSGQGGESLYLAPYANIYNHYMSRAATNRPAVLTNSYGIYALSPLPSFVAAIEDMVSDGLILTLPAGNNRENLDEIYLAPAETHPDVICVGATDAYDFPMFWQSGGIMGTGTGDSVDIYAPGTYVMSAMYGGVNTNHYYPASGTSFSTPYVAGVLACMLEGYQRLTSKEQVQAVKQRLLDNATKGFRFGQIYESGIVHDRLLYLDPHKTIEGIPELTPL